MTLWHRTALPNRLCRHGKIAGLPIDERRTARFSSMGRSALFRQEREDFTTKDERAKIAHLRLIERNRAAAIYRCRFHHRLLRRAPRNSSHRAYKKRRAVDALFIIAREYRRRRPSRRH